ncbi:MAG: M2 family metallopeptidase [Planctomycetes bacterium]|nr:M2 family metallopeptidase [Planctomycetota bacterium]
MNMTRLLSTLAIITLTIGLGGCIEEAQKQAKEDPMQTFVDGHVAKIMPMEKAANLAEWKAENTGEGEDFDRVSVLQLELKKVYANPEEFAYIKSAIDAGPLADPRLNRQVQVLYNAYLRNQIEPELLKQIVELSNEISKKFNTHRGRIDDREVTDNEIKEILKSETDSDKRKKAWLASKQVGQALADDVLRLVKLRNQAARKLGFDNFHTFSLTLSEQDPAELDKIFDRLYELTNEPFKETKAELDAILAEKYGVAVDELRPWHYHDPFFQETPLVLDLDLDTYYKGKDIAELARQFYAGINLPVEDVLAKSDLYEREGKSPHAFCTNIDRRGDVRILCNIKDNEKWMEVALHELGHAVYSKNYAPDMPYLLRGAAHIFTTEAIAMFFGRLSGNPDWMQQMLDLTDEQRNEIATVSGKYAQMKQLIFARWAMVMYNFEKSLYADPDQDLNTLWWSLVSKYQFVTPPANRNQPDWAAKIHIASAACYYHNYLLGELFGSQLHHYLVKNVLGLESDDGVSYVGQKKVGDYLRANVFEVGKSYRWNEMIKRATGEDLDPKYFVEQFVTPTK